MSALAFTINPCNASLTDERGREKGKERKGKERKGKGRGARREAARVTASALVTQASHSRAAAIPAQRRVKMTKTRRPQNDEAIARQESDRTACRSLSRRHAAPVRLSR